MNIGYFSINTKKIMLHMKINEKKMKNKFFSFKNYIIKIH